MSPAQAATGNVVLESERIARDDPMAALVARKRAREEASSVGAGALAALVGEIREQRAKKRKKKSSKKKKRSKSSKKKSKKRKRASSSLSSSSSSSSSSDR